MVGAIAGGNFFGHLKSYKFEQLKNKLNYNTGSKYYY